MPISVEIDVEISKDASSAIQRAQDRRFNDAITKAFSVSQAKVPEDRSTLRMSISEPEKTTEGVWRYSAQADHAAAIEKGTDPFTPPLRPLLEWGDRVFSPDVTADEIMAEVEEYGIHEGIFRHPGAAVWGKIRGEGIDAQPYMQPGADAAKKWLENNPFGEYLEKEL